MATIKVGSARGDERGKATGGKVGDQTGKEVSTQNFYVHSKGWYILRPKSVAHANKIAERMKAACDNDNIGYDQDNRLGVVKLGIDTKTPTESDCSSLTRQCIREATSITPQPPWLPTRSMTATATSTPAERRSISPSSTTFRE